MAALPAPDQCRRREHMAQPDVTGYALADQSDNCQRSILADPFGSASLG